MKKAPNLKHQPRDKMTEVIIFAGSDAWAHAKQWQEQDGRLAGDNVPPVWLGEQQLAELDNLQIVPDGRYRVRLYQAGLLRPGLVNTIGQKLAAAGVRDADYYPEGMHSQKRENWREYLERERGELAEKKKVVELPVKKKERVKDDNASSLALNQMGASQRGEVLLAHYGGELAIHADSDTVHHYNGVVWEPVQDKELQRAMAQIFIDAEISYSQNAIKSAVDTMKLSLPVMGNTARNLIGFSNGVFDTRTGNFREHNKNDWLLIASELPFSPPAEGETLATHAPNFWKWLRRSVAENDRKADRVLAALFMVLANRYDWQLFIEVTGPGGSGKSVMAEICTMLAGKANTVSASMKALEDARERALVVGFSLIIMPDMTRYAGDGAGIKAITGGDKVAIDPKHKAPYSTRIPAVVLAVNNNAMSFSDRSGGISRRRVIFNFSEVVPENERDPMLAEKIEGELAVVIRHLLTRFANQDEARRLLYEQQKSEEALAIKREGDSLVDFCGYLMASVMCDGLLVGNAEIVPFSPRRYLYHAYLAYTITEPYTGTVRTYLQEEVLHLRYASDDGFLGRSPVTICREALGLGLAQQRHGASIMKDGMMAAGIITSGEWLDGVKGKQALDALERYKGAKNAGKTPILEGGMDYRQLGMSNQDAEWLASRRFSIEDIARMFNVSPIFLQEYSNSTYSNFSEASRAFLTMTMRPWLANFEQQIKAALLVASPVPGTRYLVEFDSADLLRATPTERYATYEKGIKNGIMNPNEAREREGMPPREGGDEFSQAWKQTVEIKGRKDE